MPRKILMQHLADVGRELREAHPTKLKNIEIAYWAGASQSKISRFESGESQPRDIDNVVVAYAYLFGVTPAYIVREATKRWLREWGEAKPPLRLPGGPLLPPGGEIEKRAQESARDAPARLPRASPKPKRKRGNG